MTSADPDRPSEGRSDSREFGAPSLPLFAETPPPPPERTLQDRLVVLTGATGMLGSSMAAELAERGAVVCLIGRDPAELDAVISAMQPGARAAMLRCDLASAEDIVAATEFVERLDTPVDLLVHAAGLQLGASISEGPVETLDEHYLLNIRGPYLLTQRLLPIMADDRARVVFFTSPTAGRAAPDGVDAHHAISSAGLRALADELRTEVAPRGIRVLTATAGDPGVILGDGASPEYLPALAASVVDAVLGDAVDVVDLVARPMPRPVRAEQR